MQELRQFGWLGTGRIPPWLDLRGCGWTLAALPEEPARSEMPLLLADVARARAIGLPALRARVVLAGVADAGSRAELLAEFGDVIGPGATLTEIAERAARVSRHLAMLPRRRAHGRVQLDLLHREGWVGRHRLGLHPREFALLWRLAETPGVPVAPQVLLSEVWHLSHRPETNSLAVHVCRLRAKLAVAGLSHLLHTSPGGYVLDLPEPGAADLPGAQPQRDQAVCRMS